jgi:hypothetical protein
MERLSNFVLVRQADDGDGRPLSPPRWSGVEFVAVDNPHGNKLMIHILAAVAQHDRCTL